MQTKNLQITPNGVMPRVDVSQYDNDREVHFLLFDGSSSYTPPTGAEIRVEGTKKDGTGFSYACSYSGNNVTITIKSQMTVFAGDVLCELRISKGDLDIGTLNFILGVEEGALPSDIPISDTEIPAIIELARSEQYESEAWAQGTKNGIPVSSEDPQYHNNAKYWAEHSQGGSFANLSDVDIDNPSNGQVPVYNSTTQKWENGAASAGLLPHLYIDSEPESTVTVVAPDSSVITPTQISSGHWECDVPNYGVYTIHAVINGDDAVMTLTVDDVKEYHVTDAHFSYNLSVYAPSGSAIRVTDGVSETYTGTGAGSTAVIFGLHQASTTYTVQVTLDGVSKSDSVTTPSTTGGSGSKTFEYGTINVTLDADFIGETITCVNGGTTISKTASTTSLVFYPPTTGTWSISGEVSGTTYTVDAVVSSLSTAVSVSLQTLPDGSTVTPTDDIQTWLACAGITDKAYTTLNEVLADSTTLLALISNNNASDYLVRSTTWASGLTADSTAMTDIGANNYCANMLLSDSTWRNAIANSSYMESVLNVKVPTMTSDTTPSGECSANYTYSGSHPYFAFDGNESTQWASNTTPDNNTYLQYDFGEQKTIYRIYAYVGNMNGGQFKLRGSNDGSTFEDIETVSYTSTNKYDITLDTPVTYRYVRIQCHNMTTQSGWSFTVWKFQLYGRDDV